MRSVSDYGADGDGSGDDRGAIQAAVDDAHEAGGDRVHLPAGDYRVGGPMFHDCDPLDADPFPAIVRNNVGLRSESVGTAEAAGDGETAEFAVHHGLGTAPAVRNVWAEIPAATGFHVAGADDEAVRIAYADPPSEGADLRWGFDVRR